MRRGVGRRNMKVMEFPYKSLGLRLQKERQKLQETLAEVSGAVEIDIDTLRDIERGRLRPSEEVLLLLFSHFDLNDTTAATLWSLAGYDDPDAAPNDDRNAVFVMPFDVRVVYADMAHVTANKYGVVINFMQSGGPNNQPMAISRVGMSQEHARSVIDLMQKALRESSAPKTPKALPKPQAKQTKRTGSNS